MMMVSAMTTVRCNTTPLGTLLPYAFDLLSKFPTFQTPLRFLPSISAVQYIISSLDSLLHALPHLVSTQKEPL